jgi:hypothetical protein
MLMIPKVLSHLVGNYDVEKIVGVRPCGFGRDADEPLRPRCIRQTPLQLLHRFAKILAGSIGDVESVKLVPQIGPQAWKRVRQKCDEVASTAPGIQDADTRPGRKPKRFRVDHTEQVQVRDMSVLLAVVIRRAEFHAILPDPPFGSKLRSWGSSPFYVPDVIPNGSAAVFARAWLARSRLFMATIIFHAELYCTIYRGWHWLVQGKPEASLAEPGRPGKTVHWGGAGGQTGWGRSTQ